MSKQAMEMATMRNLRECVTDLADWFSDNPNTDDIETALHDLINRVEVAAIKEAIKQQGEPVAVTRAGFRLEWCAPYYGLVNGDAVEWPDGTELYAAAPSYKGEQP